jgi:hypothetical protein
MNIRHAAALALVGWYLMLPPLRDKAVHTEAPLAQWQNYGNFDTAVECLLTKTAMQKEERDPTLRTEMKAKALEQGKLDSKELDQQVAFAITLAIAGSDAAQCVSTDDPRLKGK